PQILVHNGVVDEAMLKGQRITRHELMSAIRAVGLTEFNQVRLAILENTGRINVIAKPDLVSQA
ncbi:MAG TPA: YetF domain-containing protein, partial [Holophagaceae bacterium]|nr:YetF domain-containing protein [Holophagaceae bacterium]